MWLFYPIPPASPPLSVPPTGVRPKPWGLSDLPPPYSDTQCAGGAGQCCVVDVMQGGLTSAAQQALATGLLAPEAGLL